MTLVEKNAAHKNSRKSEERREKSGREKENSRRRKSRQRDRRILKYVGVASFVVISPPKDRNLTSISMANASKMPGR